MTTSLWIKTAGAAGALLLAAGALLLPAAGEGADAPVKEASNLTGLASRYHYADYRRDHDASPARTAVPVALSSFLAADGQAELRDSYEGKSGPVLLTGDRGDVTLRFEIAQSGMYDLLLEYFPMKGKGTSIVREMKLDGGLPFDEARTLTLSRIWRDETKERITDENGNQIRPSQVENPDWQTVRMTDAVGLSAKPLQFYLSEGTHTLTLSAVKEPLAIRTLSFVPPENTVSYPDYAAAHASCAPAQAEALVIQAEDAMRKSDSMLYPTADRSSPATEPNDPRQARLNAIGGDKWNQNGQWLDWDFTVKEPGLYKIAVKFRQNTLNGAISYRALLLDGQSPFEEAACLAFPYDSGWQHQVLGGEDGGWLFYLDAGNHTLRLQAVLGDMVDLIDTVDRSVQTLSGVHKSMMMVIGSSPDTNRDYQFETLFREELQTIREQAAILTAVKQDYVTLTGLEGEQAQVLQSAIDLLEKMVKKPHRIARLFSTFVNNISALGNWSVIAKQQPLELDYLEIFPADQSAKAYDCGFFHKAGFSIQSFFYTFLDDYSAVGSKDADITIWVGNGATGGRDQAVVLNQMIKNQFTKESGVKVRLQLVQMGSILSASIAGKGPDVALTLTSTDAMNYALRGALLDLSGFEGFEEVCARFHESALTPLRFRGKTYGVPETQTFPMMFYREDILNEIGVKVPQTWRELVVVLPELQKKRMNFGLPVPMNETASGDAAVGLGMPTYAMMLFQRGGSLYNEDLTACVLDSPEAIDTFVDWTQYYTDYSLPVQYSNADQFRSGDIPILIADYSMYNTLSVFAPELQGLWKFTSVPGTEREDGSIDRTVAGTVACSVILKDCKNPEAAWKFIRWWSDTEAQSTFAVEIESILGSAGRYTPANLEALYQIPWSAADFQNLMDQWQWVRGIEEVPGSYMTRRYLDFSFKQVVVGQSASGAALKDPGEVLIRAVKTINSEIASKYKEFGYP